MTAAEQAESIHRVRVPRLPILVLLITPLLAGCGSRVDGPERYSLSGVVKLKGQPVPAGTVQLEPDGEAGNSGPATMAIIEEGRYETPDGKGIVGGAYVVRIDFYDGKKTELDAYGSPIADTHVERIELPKENSTHDFDVP